MESDLPQIEAILTLFGCLAFVWMFFQLLLHLIDWWYNG